ncbi:hypothetical protein Plhal304r1_c057g0144141 [Plasmopara halstedii]
MSEIDYLNKRLKLDERLRTNVTIATKKRASKSLDIESCLDSTTAVNVEQMCMILGIGSTDINNLSQVIK